MNRIIWLLVVFLVISLPIFATAENTKDKIAVVDFQLQGGPFDNKDLGAFVAEWLITAIVRDGRFDVVERRLLENVINEQKLMMTGLVDEANASQLGNLLGAKNIITGSIMKSKQSIEINARIIDVASASVITAEIVRNVNPQNLQQSVVSLSERMLANFPLQGYVVSRNGGNVTLDLGSKTGVKAGMQFVVYHEGQPIEHPKTGEVLGKEQIRMGVVAITSIMEKISLAKIQEETNQDSIDCGDLVRSTAETHLKKSALVVNTQPKNTTIRILNSTSPFQQNMQLPQGSYQLEVSAMGYRTKQESITIRDGEKTIHFSKLDPLEPSGEETAEGYIRQKDGTILDTQADLLWLSTIEGIMSWPEANSYVKKINQKKFHGYQDWRIPNKEELLRAARFARANPGFFKVDDSWFWSSTKDGPITAWLVNMGHAKPDWNDFDQFANSKDFELPYAVRLVRNHKNQ